MHGSPLYMSYPGLGIKSLKFQHFLPIPIVGHMLPPCIPCLKKMSGGIGLIMAKIENSILELLKYKIIEQNI